MNVSFLTNSHLMWKKNRFSTNLVKIWYPISPTEVEYK